MSGTPTTSPVPIANSVDASGICDIIKTCGQHRVKVFRFGDIVIYFDEAPLEELVDVSLNLPTDRLDHERSETDKAEVFGRKQEKLDMVEFEAEDLLLNDPLAYEEAEAGVLNAQ